MMMMTLLHSTHSPPLRFTQYTRFPPVYSVPLKTHYPSLDHYIMMTRESSFIFLFSRPFTHSFIVLLQGIVLNCTQHCTYNVLCTVLYTALYCVLHCVLYCILHCILHCTVY